MDNNQAQKLLGYLYQIVPEKKSATEISKEVFSNIAITDMLTELLQEGYIYQSKSDVDDKLQTPLQEQFGITVKGILFFGKFSVDKKKNVPVIPIPVTPVAVIEKMAAPAEIKIEPVKEEKISLMRILPAIILIGFAIALVWFIIHIKK
jgi:hypothetical protein